MDYPNNVRGDSISIIELAKSSRSSCRLCKQKIEKDTPRMGVETEMRQGDRTFTAVRWYHLSCALEKLPEEVVTAEIKVELPAESMDEIEKLKEQEMQSSFIPQGISVLDKANITVNVEAIVLRVLKMRVLENSDGIEVETKTVYVEHGKQRRKILLQEEKSGLEMNKGDRIVVIAGITMEGSDEKIQVIANNNSKVLINPTEEELDKYSQNIEVFVSSAWSRPGGKKAIFEYAKSARAACPVCNEKIIKGELKIIKPIWGKNEKTGQAFASNTSFHVLCAEQDEHGVEFLHEAVTRLSIDLLADNKKILSKLCSQLDDNEVKKILEQLLI